MRAEAKTCGAALALTVGYDVAAAFEKPSE
jgi:hypothetical protein